MYFINWGITIKRSLSGALRWRWHHCCLSTSHPINGLWVLKLQLGASVSPVSTLG